MEKASALLFSGVRVDRKRFSREIARFQASMATDSVLRPKKEPDDLEDIAHAAPEALLEVKANKKEKKRKRKDKDSSGCNSGLPTRTVEVVPLVYNSKSYILRNLSELGFCEPTPIQRQAIPVLLSFRTNISWFYIFQKRDCFACSPTGSGKTFAFLCPMLMKIKVSLLYMDYHLPGLKNGVKAVVLCPTRELAAQTARECKKLAKGRKFYIKLMTKELSRRGDFEKMPCDIIISTPLRLDFAICQRKLDLSRYELKKTLNVLTTFDRNSASEMIKQKLLFAGSERGKLLAIRQSFAESLNPPVLVFVQSKERAKELYKELAFDDIKVDVIHADLSQQQREDAVDNFRSGKTWVLIATDVVSRGMDFKGINCVINFDFPESAAAYIHRIGMQLNFFLAGCSITFL
ncbi:hypothetical protein GW17_00004218 [Ensete ventricosum]|nr:hypothetical protein GW17_00004218 [Ensete ventricosum]